MPTISLYLTHPARFHSDQVPAPKQLNAAGEIPTATLMAYHSTFVQTSSVASEPPDKPYSTFSDMICSPTL